MNKTLGAVLAVLLVLPLTAPVALAEKNATQKMAQIVSQLNHRPSMGDKEVLREIGKKGTEAEKTIAKALMMMDHNVTAEYKEKLSMISKDRDVPENTRELANIVQNINHKVSSKEKMILKDM